MTHLVLLRVRYLILAALCCAGPLLVACGGGTTGTGGDGVSVKGRVTDLTQSPLINYEITIAETGDSGRTDQNGGFNIHAEALLSEFNLLIEGDKVQTAAQVNDIPLDSESITVSVVVNRELNRASAMIVAVTLAGTPTPALNRNEVPGNPSPQPTRNSQESEGQHPTPKPSVTIAPTLPTPTPTTTGQVNPEPTPLPDYDRTVTSAQIPADQVVISPASLHLTLELGDEQRIFENSNLQLRYAEMSWPVSLGLNLIELPAQSFSEDSTLEIMSGADRYAVSVQGVSPDTALLELRISGTRHKLYTDYIGSGFWLREGLATFVTQPQPTPLPQPTRKPTFSPTIFDIAPKPIATIAKPSPAEAPVEHSPATT